MVMLFTCMLFIASRTLPRLTFNMVRTSEFSLAQADPSHGHPFTDFAYSTVSGWSWVFSTDF
ncbi:hypothetical protein M758_4G255100 [Ceratodon purpureus]|nr:hypothetical protein M758_4G255100 [Ceratodon purpureus]